MSEIATGADIMAEENADKRHQIVGLLETAYWMEIETVMSYIAGSVNPDGVRAQEIKESLEQDITEELGHAQQFAQRIKELYGVVPGSEEFGAEQSYLQPPEHQTDIVHVIKGVIAAETGAIEHYSRIIAETEAVDPVTQDMVIDILRDEQGHLRLFEGFLREYEAEGAGLSVARLGGQQLEGQLGEVVDAVALRLRRGQLERLARLLRIRLAQQAPPQVLAAGGIERAAEPLPRGAGLRQRGARLVRIGRHRPPGLEARGLADRVAQPVREPLRLVGGLAGGVEPPGQGKVHGAGGDRLDRLGDQARALAEVERARQLGVGVRVIAALAQRRAKPEQRLEGDLGAAHLLGEVSGLAQALGRLVESPLAPAEHAAHHVREAELARQAFALGELPGRLGLSLHRVPVAAVRGQLGQRGVQLDLGRQVARLLGELERLLVGGAGALVVGLRDLEVIAEREQRPDRLGRIGLARELDRALQVLAGALGVADAAEDAAEDPVGPACRRRLAESLRESQRLLGGVDGEHVVAGVHVQRGGLLVQPHQLEARGAVLEQVDPLLVVLDRALAVALVPEPGADLAMQVADPGQVLLAAMEVQALLARRRWPGRRARAEARRRRASRRSGRAPRGPLAPEPGSPGKDSAVS